MTEVKMKYEDVREDAEQAIADDQTKAEKEKREIAIGRVRRLMLEIDHAKDVLEARQRQLGELMEKEVEDPDNNFLVTPEKLEALSNQIMFPHCRCMTTPFNE